MFPNAESDPLDTDPSTLLISVQLCTGREAKSAYCLALLGILLKPRATYECVAIQFFIDNIQGDRCSNLRIKVLCGGNLERNHPSALRMPGYIDAAVMTGQLKLFNLESSIRQALRLVDGCYDVELERALNRIPTFDLINKPSPLTKVFLLGEKVQRMAKEASITRMRLKDLPPSVLPEWSSIQLEEMEVNPSNYNASSYLQHLLRERENDLVELINKTGTLYGELANYLVRLEPFKIIFL